MSGGRGQARRKYHSHHPTASGKTLAYTLPVLEKLMQNRDATAQFIYPTKTLTRDQLAVL